MLLRPKFFDYWYIDDETEKWCIKEDAPVEAKEEFDNYFRKLNDKVIKY